MLVLAHNTWKLIALLASAVVFVFLSRYWNLEAADLQRLNTGLPWLLSTVLFVVAYVVLSFFIWVGPKDVFRIGGAIIYGPYWSTLLVFIAELINAIVLVTYARRLGRDFVEHKVQGRVQRVDDAVADSGYGTLFVLRFFPIVPFRFLDLGVGLTGIPLRRYLLVVVLASPVRILFTQFYLALGIDVVLDQSKLQLFLTEHSGILYFSLIYLLLSIVALAVLRGKSRRKQLPG